MISMEIGSPQWKKFMMEQCDVPEKFINYLVTGFHFQFEEADKQENIEWFNHFSKKHLEFMDFHCNWTYPTFQWICYRKWRGKGNDPCEKNALKRAVQQQHAEVGEYEGLKGQGTDNVYII